MAIHPFPPRTPGEYARETEAERIAGTIYGVDVFRDRGHEASCGGSRSPSV
jgi:hypothetical protein